MAVLRGSPELSSAELEKETLKKYKRLCERSMKNLEIDTTIAKDAQILADPNLAGGRTRYCTVYRHERKKITQSHIAICDMILNAIEKRTTAQEGEWDTVFKSAIEERYMAPESDSELRYVERRLKNAQYLCNLYNLLK